MDGRHEVNISGGANVVFLDGHYFWHETGVLKNSVNDYFDPEK